jgi:MoaA/NifB/PqqE/SkfB family radical SAM enzyme
VNKPIDILTNYHPYLPLPLRGLNWQPHPLDGALLLFEHDTGLNVKLEGEETAHLERVAPRTLLIAVTNVCDLSCPFCYRNLTSSSDWTYQSLLEFCQQASEWGVLEVAFGGGEPLLFPRWGEFIHELYETTTLGINFTTNGMKLTEEFLHSIEGKYGNIRFSLYETNHYEQTVQLLVDCGARFGVNWLITPDELPYFETRFLRLLELGVRDFLLLSYKGNDPSLHFQQSHYAEFATFIQRMYTALNGIAQIKLDVCWGDLLPDVPRLFETPDCGAGHGFLSITSDKRVKACSFHHKSIPFQTLDDVRLYWQAKRHTRHAAAIGGCARLPNRALTNTGGINDESIHLAAV